MQRSDVVWWSAAGSLLAGFVACSLDLDEALLAKGDAGADSSLGGSSGTGGGASGGNGGTGGKILDSGGACDANAECETDGGCVEGRCSGGTCVYELCPVSTACTARACDTTTAVNTCKAPEAFTFRAGTVTLPDAVGCSGVPGRCVAAMDDYVFVGTTSGLNAWRVLSPLAPEPVNVQSPSFAITRMVAIDNRLFILGPASAGKLSIAWIDVPSDPLATDLTINSAGVNFSDTYAAAYPAAQDRMFLVQNDTLFPAAYLPHPLTSQTTVTLYPSAGLVSGASVVAASGARLLAYLVDTSLGVYEPQLGFITAAGTSSAQAGALQAQTFEAPNSLSAHHFTSGYDGSVLWTTNRIEGAAGSQETTGVVLRWPVIGSSGSIDAGAEVVLASFNPTGVNAALAGPSAVITPTLALATVAYPPDPQQTLVRSVSRSGSTLTLGSETPPPVLPFPPSQIGVAANRRYGFVLTPPSQSPTTATTLHIFAPGC